MYDGDPAKFQGFLLQFELFIMPQGEMTDQHKPIASFNHFVVIFCRLFNHAPEGTEVSERLMSLTQGRLSVVEFALRFRKLVAESEWNELALKAAFRRGPLGAGVPRK